MVAGATGIDLYLMVVAADDGVMPQTREHAAVLTALGVRRGVVAITKADLADPARASEAAAALLPGAEIVPVAAPSGEGLAELRAALDRGRRRARPAAEQRGRAAAARRPLVHDSRRGHGGHRHAVGGCRGARRRGRASPVRPLRTRPLRAGPRRAARVRRGRPRGATLNLAGVGRDEVGRGDVVVARRRAGGSFRVDVALSWVTPDARPDGGTRVAVHHGTRETPARLAELGGRYFQLRLEQPLVPARGDRLVIRSLAPPDTLGGGVVLDPDPPRHGPSRDLLARLARLERGEPEPKAPPAPEPEPASPVPLSPAALELEQRLREARPRAATR